MALPQPTLAGPTGAQFSAQAVDQFMQGMGQMASSLTQLSELKEKQRQFDTNKMVEQFKALLEGPFQNNWKALTSYNEEIAGQMALLFAKGDKKMAATIQERWDARPPTAEEFPLMSQLFQNEKLINKYGGDVGAMLDDLMPAPQTPERTNVGYATQPGAAPAGGQQFAMPGGQTAQTPAAPATTTVQPPSGTTKGQEWTIVETSFTNTPNQGALRSIGADPNIETIDAKLAFARDRLRLGDAEMEEARKEIMNGMAEKAIVGAGRRPEGPMLGQKAMIGGGQTADATTGAAPRVQSTFAAAQPVANVADMERELRSEFPAVDTADPTAVANAVDTQMRAKFGFPASVQPPRKWGNTWTREGYVAKYGEDAAKTLEAWGQQHNLPSFNEVSRFRQQMVNQVQGGREVGNWQPLSDWVEAGQPAVAGAPQTEQATVGQGASRVRAMFSDSQAASDAAVRFAQDAYSKTLAGEPVSSKDVAATKTALGGLERRAQVVWRRTPMEERGGRMYTERENELIGRLGMSLDDFTTRMNEIASAPEQMDAWTRMQVPKDFDQRRVLDATLKQVFSQIDIAKVGAAVDVARLSLEQRKAMFDEYITQLEAEAEAGQLHIPKELTDIITNTNTTLVDLIKARIPPGTKPEDAKRMMSELVDQEKGDPVIREWWATRNKLLSTLTGIQTRYIQVINTLPSRFLPGIFAGRRKETSTVETLFSEGGQAAGADEGSAGVLQWLQENTL